MMLTCEIRAHAADETLVVEGFTQAKIMVFSRRQLITSLDFDLQNIRHLTL